jgi:hypothetical protein
MPDILAQYPEHRLEIRWRVNFEAHRIAAGGVNKFEPPGVQGLTTKTPQHRNDFFARAGRQCEATAVNLITDKGVAAVREVHANLMRATRLQHNPYICVCRESFDHCVVGYRWFPLWPDTHAPAINRMPTHRLINRTATRQDTVANSQVVARDFTVAQQTD